jgi:hypothetical protein
LFTKTKICYEKPVFGKKADIFKKVFSTEKYENSGKYTDVNCQVCNGKGIVY